MLPADPARLILGPMASSRAIAQERVQLGLNHPVFVQYGLYISQFVRGQWGFDYSNGIPVLQEIGEKLPASLELGFYAMLFAIFGSLIAAVTSVWSGWADKVARSVAFVGLGSAPFWMGLVFILLFAQYLHVLPGPVGRLAVGTSPPPTVTGFYTIDALVAGQWSTFLDAVEHLILPAITLGLAPFGYLFRLLRQSLKGTADQEFMLVCEGKGLTRLQVILRHGVPNAVLPALTAAGLLVAQLVAGSILVESVFDWPGVGQLVVNSIVDREYAVVQAFVIMSAIAFVLVNILVDSLYSVIDPRLRRPAVEEAG
jgi:peptide/nickel transport system permease protein